MGTMVIGVLGFCHSFAHCLLSRTTPTGDMTPVGG